MHRVVAALSLLVVLSACPGSRTTDRTAAKRPRLVVLVVVDQLPVWVFERDRPLFRHGFARLQREAAYAVAELPYANTFTAPGHATMGTGAPPSVTGIVANSWYRRAEGRERPAEYDPEVKVFTVGPSHGEPLGPGDGASSRGLRVGGTADILRATHPTARSISISLKPRAATLMTGKRPDIAIWYEAGAGGMTTSSTFAREAPQWLKTLAREKPVARFLGQTWKPLDESLLGRTTLLPDDAPGESVVHGLDRAFPHTVSSEIKDNRALLLTPFADEAVLDTVLAAIPAYGLGADDVPDLLAISFNAHDYAGHAWGPDSWEVLDLTLRLDVLLGTLFDTLDRELGRDGWAVVLSSDHGSTPLVERARVAHSRRIPTDEIRLVAEAALGTYGEGPWIAAISSNNVYFTAKLAGLSVTARTAALETAAKAIAAVPGVAAAGLNERLDGACHQRTGLDRAICLSIVGGESGELYVLARQGSLISEYTSGTGHDAPFEDNRLVPVYVKAPGLRPRVGKASTLQIAPTISALLGVPAPEAATARPLFDLSAR